MKLTFFLAAASSCCNVTGSIGYSRAGILPCASTNLFLVQHLFRLLKLAFSLPGTQPNLMNKFKLLRKCSLTIHVLSGLLWRNPCLYYMKQKETGWRDGKLRSLCCRKRKTVKLWWNPIPFEILSASFCIRFGAYCLSCFKMLLGSIMLAQRGCARCIPGRAVELLPGSGFGFSISVEAFLWNLITGWNIAGELREQRDSPANFLLALKQWL